MYNGIVDALMPYSIYTYSQPNIRPVIVPPKCRNLYVILVGGGGGGAGHNASNEFNKYPGGGGGGGGVVACIINVENLAMNSHSSFQPDTNVSDRDYYGFYVTVGYGGEGGYGSDTSTTYDEIGSNGVATTLSYRDPGQNVDIVFSDTSIKISANGGSGGGGSNRTTYYNGGSGGTGTKKDDFYHVKWFAEYKGSSGVTAESNNAIINSASPAPGGAGGKINTTSVNFRSFSPPYVIEDNFTLPNIKSTGGQGAPRNYYPDGYSFYLNQQHADGYGGGGGGAGKTDKEFDSYGGLYRGGNGSDGIAIIFFEF